ncbi:MAG: phenylalanine--tRNA ligase subunit beta [Clostridiales bacterium]|nr:phenylalanine--tRNA ligase subunit beta [Clostridiales bacterium]
MRVSYKWLQRYVNINLSPEELAERLTMAGLAVDEIEYRGRDISKVVTARITDCRPHPASDHLSVCQADAGGDKKYQVVCGAPNVAAGQMVCLALPGATLPGGLEIGVATLAGTSSQGMICSRAELGIDPLATEGIMVLPANLKPGQDVVSALDLLDAVLILDLTPNRSDCLAIFNVAREVAAICGSRVQILDSKIGETSPEISSLFSLDVLDEQACPRYLARLVKGVKVGPSPLWIQNYLLTAGMRPINNIVDISNFVMLETGNPLHTFDYNKLSGQKIVVRRALEGEKLLTLDKKERALRTADLMICDGRGPVCLAGVMGGLESEVTETTTDVLIEAAAFNPALIRDTAHYFGIPSEASLRFEKGVDIEACALAAKRAAQLIAEYAGGIICRGALDVCRQKSQAKVISLNKSRVNQILGSNYSFTDIASVLQSLGFALQPQGKNLLVTIPSYRQDISLEEDLIEEVARLHGYEQIPTTLPAQSATQGYRSYTQELRRKVGLFAADLGLAEVINYSFISPREFERLLLPERHPWRNHLRIINPLNEEQSLMRTTLLPGLLNNAARNFSRRNLDIALFELGACFFPHQGEPLPKENDFWGMILSGKQTGGWYERSGNYDYFYLKGLLEALNRHLKGGLLEFVPAGKHRHSFLHPGRSSDVRLDGQIIGYLGEIHPSVTANYDIDQAVFALEIAIEPLFTGTKALREAQSLPRYPGANRDLAFIAPITLPEAEIAAAIQQSAGPYLCRLELFDLYDKPPIEQGKRSLAYNLFFQNPERTLTDGEINEIVMEIIAKAEELGLKLR